MLTHTTWTGREIHIARPTDETLRKLQKKGEGFFIYGGDGPEAPAVVSISIGNWRCSDCGADLGRTARADFADHICDPQASLSSTSTSTRTYGITQNGNRMDLAKGN